MPFRAAKELGYALDYFIEGVTQAPPMELGERVLIPLLSDVLVLSNVYGQGLTDNIKTISELKPVINESTLKREYPPVCVFDQDDSTHNVSIFNDTFLQLGTRAPTGEVLKPGDKIFMKDSAGNDIPLWEDGVCDACRKGHCLPGLHAEFNIERNLETVGKIEALARACHGATFTTEQLARFYREEVGIKRTYVFPNSIYLMDYAHVDLAEHPNEVRILWQGGSSHFEDWWQYKGILGRVCAKYPQVKVIMWGQPFGWLLKEIPAEQREFIHWMDHAGYIMRLNTLGHDINLAPLIKSKFNECKSAIKWYESSSITRPAATLASNVSPYGDEIIDGETGLLADSPQEFEQKLCGLIEDATLRKQLAANAKDWVLTHRRIEVTLPPLLEFYQSLQGVYDEAFDSCPTMDALTTEGGGA